MTTVYVFILKIRMLLFLQVSDTSVHEFICLFTAILISRSCFSLEDLINHALLPSLSDAVDSGNIVKPSRLVSCWALGMPVNTGNLFQQK